MKNDPWSNYPKTQFRPTYPFFGNPEPKPILRAVKVHFDWTWILRLKRFFLREFSSKIILINHPPIWDEFWIFECIMGQSKKKGKKRKWMKRQRSDSIWSLYEVLYPFPKTKNLNLLFKSSFPKFLSLSRWVLTPVKLPYSETRKNESL